MLGPIRVAEAQLISDLSFRQSGRVDEVNVKVGDVIRRGDVLAAMEAMKNSNPEVIAHGRSDSVVDDILSAPALPEPCPSRSARTDRELDSSP